MLSEASSDVWNLVPSTSEHEFSVTIVKPKPNARLGVVLQPQEARLRVVELQESGLAAASGKVCGLDCSIVTPCQRATLGGLSRQRHSPTW